MDCDSKFLVGLKARNPKVGDEIYRLPAIDKNQQISLARTAIDLVWLYDRIDPC